MEEVSVGEQSQTVSILEWEAAVTHTLIITHKHSDSLHIPKKSFAVPLEPGPYG